MHTGKPRYEETQSSVAFISDVAGKHKVRSYAFRPDHRRYSSLSAPLLEREYVTDKSDSRLYPLSLLAERWLRYAHRLPEDIRRRENILCT